MLRHWNVQTRKLATVGVGLWVTLAAGCDQNAALAPVQAPANIQGSGGYIATGGEVNGSGGDPLLGGTPAPNTGAGEFAGGVPAATGGVEPGQPPPTGGAPTTAGGGEWCEALTVFRTACSNCHGPEIAGGAPMPLATYEDTQGISVLDQSTPIIQRIGERIHDPSRPMPPTSQPPLTDVQMAALDAWIAAGAPSSEDPTCGGAPVVVADGDEAWPDDCEEFYKFTANEAGGPYMVPADSELYIDFSFQVPWGGKGPVQALAVRPIVGNKRVLHHWILYRGEYFLTGWAPGGKGANSPDGVGIYMPDSGTLKMTNHYYNKGNNNIEPDESGVEVCITRSLRPMTSSTYPFIAPSNAPAGQKTTNVDTCTVRLTDPSQPTYLLNSSPHMHQLGVHAKLEVIRADGSVEVLHDKPFSFDDQVAVDLPEPVQLNDGDQVRTTCVFQNSTSTNVRFGTGSYDEMCFNYASYYPACGMTCNAQDPISSFIATQQGAGCPSK